MKKTLFIFLFALFFTACGSDSSISANNSNDDDISSKSSSSVKIASSSSVPSSSSSTKGRGSSSSSAKSSSSIVAKSSSSQKTVSSSSDKVAELVDSADVIVGSMKDPRDGQTYKTVKIGEQVWMAENLNYANLQPTTKLDSSSFCYKDSVEYCEKYGRLYLWSAAMDSVGAWSTNGKGCGYGKTCSPTYPVRGVCPEGWHLPTRTEWDTLRTAVDRGSLKSTSGWSSNGNGTDDFSFSALPAGRRHRENYNLEGDNAFFWSSTEDDRYYAYIILLYYGDDRAGLDNFNKNNDGVSVRCLQD